MELDLATTLKEFRQQHAMEQAELARLLDTTQQTVSNWEKGTVPRSGTLRKISHLINTYKGGQPLEPVPPRPVFDPAISAIHDIRVKSEIETRREVAQSLMSAVHEPLSRFRSPRQDVAEQITLLLPPDLGFKVDQTFEYQGLRRRVDFDNGTVACNVTTALAASAVSASEDPRRIGLNVLRAVELNAMRLITVRAMHRLAQGERRIYAILVKVEEDVMRQANLSQPMTLAAMHDLRLVLFTTAQQAADSLLMLTYEAQSAPEFSDFSDDIEDLT